MRQVDHIGAPVPFAQQRAVGVEGDADGVGGQQQAGRQPGRGAPHPAQRRADGLQARLLPPRQPAFVGAGGRQRVQRREPQAQDLHRRWRPAAQGAETRVLMSSARLATQPKAR